MLSYGLSHLVFAVHAYALELLNHNIIDEKSHITFNLLKVVFGVFVGPCCVFVSAAFCNQIIISRSTFVWADCRGLRFVKKCHGNIGTRKINHKRLVALDHL